MENASKALLIAGAVLIAILVVSLIIYLAISGGNFLISNTNNDSSEIKVFNSKFMKYEGNSVSGTDVKQLLKDVNAVKQNTGENISLTGKTTSNEIKNNENYKVTLSYSDDTVKKHTNIINELIQNNRENKYTCSISFYENGKVSDVKFTKQ